MFRLEVFTQEGDRMLAKGQPDVPVILDDSATARLHEQLSLIERFAETLG